MTAKWEQRDALALEVDHLRAELALARAELKRMEQRLAARERELNERWERELVAERKRTVATSAAADAAASRLAALERRRVVRWALVIARVRDRLPRAARPIERR